MAVLPCDSFGECGGLVEEDAGQAYERSGADCLRDLRGLKRDLARHLQLQSPPFRGLIGLALCVDGAMAFDVAGRALVPSKEITAWALIDGGRTSNRGALLSELRVKIQHDRVVTWVPNGPIYSLGLETEECCSDARVPRSLPRDDERVQLLAAQLDWSLSATAARAHRQGWEWTLPRLQSMDWVGVAARRAVASRPHPEIWAPIPFVRSQLTASVGTGNFCRFPLSLKTRFMDDLRHNTPVFARADGPVNLKEKSPWLLLSQRNNPQRVLLGPQTEIFVQDGQDVPAGTQLACDWPTFPEEWHACPMRERWIDVQGLYGDLFPQIFTNWWERQRLGCWLPLSLVIGRKLDIADLVWDFGTHLSECFDDLRGSYIAPPIFPRDLQFHGELAHGVSYDLRRMLS